MSTLVVSAARFIAIFVAAPLLVSFAADKACEFVFSLEPSPFVPSQLMPAYCSMANVLLVNWTFLVIAHFRRSALLIVFAVLYSIAGLVGLVFFGTDSIVGALHVFYLIAFVHPLL